MPIGMVEVVALFVAGLFMLVPVALGIWGVITLVRIRSIQDDMRSRLARIEQALPTAPGRAPEAP